MPAPQFVHLRVHSDFSMVDGLAKTKPIVAQAQELALPAFAIIGRADFASKLFVSVKNPGYSKFSFTLPGKTPCI